LRLSYRRGKKFDAIVSLPSSEFIEPLVVVRNAICPIARSGDAEDVTSREADVRWGCATEHYLGRQSASGEKAMRSILALSLLIALSGVANAATVHHTHRHATVRTDQGATNLNSSFAYTPAQPPAQFGSTSSCEHEAYYGACQGYAPGEKEHFLNSLHGP